MTPQAQALLDELAGYALVPTCAAPTVARWTQDLIPCNLCEGCASLALAGQIIERHLEPVADGAAHDAT